MALTVNEDIIDFIRENVEDEDVQNFIIQALMLEFKREKEDLRNYTKQYDQIISNYIKMRVFNDTE